MDYVPKASEKERVKTGSDADSNDGIRRTRLSVDERLDEALKQTFPASDAFEISAK